MNIGENIKKQRERLGMEQKELADKLGLSNKTISSWECGRTEPRMGMIEDMCVIFGIDKTTLIDGIIEVEKPVNHSDVLLSYAEKLGALNPEQLKNAMEYIDYLKEKGEKK